MRPGPEKASDWELSHTTILLVAIAVLSVLVVAKWIHGNQRHYTIDIRDPRIIGFYVAYEQPLNDNEFGDGSGWGPNLYIQGESSVAFAPPPPMGTRPRFRVILSNDRSCFGDPSLNVPSVIDARLIDDCLARNGLIEPP